MPDVPSPAGTPHADAPDGEGPADPLPPGACWPCSRCGAAMPLQADSCAACGAGFLAALHEQAAPLLVLPGVGDVVALDRAHRLLLAAGVVLAVVLLVALLGLLG